MLLCRPCPYRETMPRRAPIHKPRHAPANKREADRRYDRDVRARVPHLRRARDLRNSAKWKSVRAYMLHRHPTCACGAPATQVHHVRPLGSNPREAYRRSNLETVCTRCHARASAGERRGREPA